MPKHNCIGMCDLTMENFAEQQNNTRQQLSTQYQEPVMWSK